jgi:hypothetical protein
LPKKKKLHAGYKLKAEKKSAIKSKTKETQSTGRPKIEYCTVKQLIVAISISFIKLFNTEPSHNDINIKSVMGLIAIFFKQMYGYQFDLQKGINITNRVTTDII